MQATLSQLLFALVILCGSAATAAADAADDQYAVASGHYSRGDWAFAIDEFRGFLRDHPDHSKANQARFYLAEALVQDRKFAEAATLFRDFLTREPEHRLARQALFRAGESSYLADDVEGAAADFLKFQEKYPTDALHDYVLAYRGDLAIRAKDAAAAQKLFADGLQRFPMGKMQDDHRLGLARALEMQGQHAEARALFELLAAKTDSALADDAQFRLGAQYFDQQNYLAANKAFESFETTFKESEWRVQARLGRGQALFHTAKYEKARSFFSALASDADVGGEARYWLGLTLKAERRWAEAAEQLLSVVADPAASNFAEAARFHAGESLLQDKRIAEAREQFTTLLSQHADGEFADDAALGQIRCDLNDNKHAEVAAAVASFASRFPASTRLTAAQDALIQSHVMQRQFDQAAAVLAELPADGGSNSSRQYLLAQIQAGQSKHADALKTLAPLLTNQNDPLHRDARRAQAASLVALGRFDEAIATIEPLLVVETDAEAAALMRSQRAISFARLKKMDEARAAYQDLLTRHPDSPVVPPTTEALAEAAIDAGETKWAEELFARMAEDASGARTAKGLSGQAWSQYQSDKLDAAQSTFERLLKEFPEHALAAEAALVRGQILEKLQQPDAALAMYQRVLTTYETSTHLPTALLAAARLHDDLQQDAEAAQLYERLEKEYPELPERDAVLYESAWVLRDLKRLDEADAKLELLRTQFPHSRFWPDAVYRMAEYAFQYKKFDRASELVTELNALPTDSPVLPHALYLQAQLAAAKNDWPAAVAPLEQLIRDYPDHSLHLLAHYWLAESLYRQEKFTEADERFAHLAELSAGKPDKWLAMIPLRRAQILAQQKEWSKAQELAAKIASDWPDFDQQYEVDYLLGRCYASQAEFDQAREAYTRVVRSDRGGKTETAAMAQWMIGESYFHQKNHEAALKEYLRIEFLYDYPKWQAAALLQAGKCHEALDHGKQAIELYARLIKDYPDTEFTAEASQRLQSVKSTP